MEQQTENNGNANVSMAPVYVAVFCTALAALALELVQTRVLSALFHNHVVSLTITIALMGFGISGVFVSLLSGRVGSPGKWVATCIGLFCVTAIVCLRFAGYAPILFLQNGFLFKLLFCHGVLIVSFLCSGAALGLIFMMHGKHIHRLYPRFIPCAWGVNGLTGVMTSVLAVLLAMQIGFMAV